MAHIKTAYDLGYQKAVADHEKTAVYTKQAYSAADLLRAGLGGAYQGFVPGMITGAMSAPKGHRGSGALRGAAGGALTGALGGAAGHAIGSQFENPAALSELAQSAGLPVDNLFGSLGNYVGGIGGGALGGYLARDQEDPSLLEMLKQKMKMK